MLDFCGISVYVWGSSIAYYSFFSDDAFIGIPRRLFLVSMALHSILPNWVCSWSFVRHIDWIHGTKCRALSFAVPFVLGNVPLVGFVINISSLRSDFSTLSPILIRHLLLSSVGGLMYAANIPERWFPNKYDIFGHSHQLFHVFITFGTGEQLKILKEILKTPDSLPNLELEEIILWTAITFVCCVAINAFFFAEIMVGESKNNKRL